MEWTASDLEASPTMTPGKTFVPGFGRTEALLTASHQPAVQATPPLATESGWSGLDTAALRTGGFEDALLTRGGLGDSLATVSTDTSPASMAVLSAPHTLLSSDTKSAGTSTGLAKGQWTCQDSPLLSLSLSSQDLSPSSSCLPPLVSKGPPDHGHLGHAGTSPSLLGSRVCQ